MPLKHDFKQSQQIPDNQIILGDCIDVLKTLPSESVDLVVTDPPYLVNYKSNDGRTILNDKNEDWMKPAFEQIYRTLKKNTFMVCFYGWPKVDRFMEHWKSAGFFPVGHLVWPKRYSSRSRYVAYSHEQAYLLAKGWPEVPAEPIKDIQRWHYSGNGLHPTQKSVNILTPLIESFSKAGDLIVDPFCGSGSTAIAAHQLGRRFLAIEKSPDYFKIAHERLQQIHAVRLDNTPEPS